MIKDKLIAKFENKTANIAVLGLGYVGLPFASVFAEAGFCVTGIDPDASKVEKLNQGISYIQDVSTEQVARLVSKGRLMATTDFSVLTEAMRSVSVYQHHCERLATQIFLSYFQLQMN